MTERYCKDCRWMQRWGDDLVCNAPKSLRRVTTGQPYIFCHEQRDDAGFVFTRGRERCGTEGAWWEAKPLPWWRRWFT